MKISKQVPTGQKLWSKKIGHSVKISKSITGHTHPTLKPGVKEAVTHTTYTSPKTVVKDNSRNNLAAAYTFKFKTGT